MKKSILITIFSTIILTLIIDFAYAADIGPGSLKEFYDNIIDATQKWTDEIFPYITMLLIPTSLIAFIIGCKDLILRSGGVPQFEGIIGLLVRFSLIIGVIVWLKDNPNYLLAIPKSIAMLGTSMSGEQVNFAGISGYFVGLTDPITDYYRNAQHDDTGIKTLCWFLVFCIHCVLMLFIATVLLVQIEMIFVIYGGLLTLAFFIIGYFRDLFLGYIRALAISGLKLLLLSLILGIMLKIISSWVPELTTKMLELNGPFEVAIPMVATLIAFYVILRTVPNFAISILTGRITMGGSLVQPIATVGIAGTALGNVTQGVSPVALNDAGAVHQAAEAYKNAAQSVKDSGGGAVRATSIGAWEAIKTVFAPPASNGGYSGGPLINTSEEIVNTRNGNETRPVSINDAFKANDSYNREMKGKGGKG